MSNEPKPDQQNEERPDTSHYHGEGPLPPAKPVKKSTLWILGIVVLLIAVLVLVLGIFSRHRADKKLAKRTDEEAAPTVTVSHPQAAAPSQEVVLPSNVQAFMDAPIYARTSGYIKAWYFDIGSHVRQGQLLAVIESPEIDQQLSQARADLQTTLANARLANVTANRYVDLLKSDSVSKQDTDNAVQNAAAQNSNVQSQQANVNRLEQLVAFERVTAPFDGVITQRNTDVGQLVNSGNNGTQELFHEANTRKLRVFVSVPQSYVLDARPGLPAYLTLDEFPMRKFTGTLVRTANAIDVPSRTLNIEIDLDNKDGTLLPGAYAAVHLPVKSAGETYVIPVSALMFRAEGLRVGTVVDGNVMKMVKIVPGRDYGTVIEILSGLKPEDDVITNPPDSGVDGTKVRIVKPDGQNASAGSGSGGQGGSDKQGGSGSGSGNGKQKGQSDTSEEKQTSAAEKEKKTKATTTTNGGNLKGGSKQGAMGAQQGDVNSGASDQSEQTGLKGTRPPEGNSQGTQQATQGTQSQQNTSQSGQLQGGQQGGKQGKKQ